MLPTNFISLHFREYDLRELVIGLPGFLFLDLGQELLIGDGLVELPSSGSCHLLQLEPNIVQLLKAIVDFGSTELGCIDQGLSGILHSLKRNITLSVLVSLNIFYLLLRKVTFMSIIVDVFLRKSRNSKAVIIR